MSAEIFVAIELLSAYVFLGQTGGPEIQTIVADVQRDARVFTILGESGQVL
jgi:hypothetical protein